ncbi:CRISPR-associated endonuclease Cas2 [Streptomonospora sediminis]
MFVIVVYDTLAERNPRVLKTCRRYLRWVQRSVFQGELSTAQYRSFIHAVEAVIDTGYDSVVIYRVQGASGVQTDIVGQQLASDSPVL